MTNPRVAVVTGANKGIGAAIAEGLARQGMAVVVAARDAGRGAATASRLGTRSVVLDVTDDASVREAAGQVETWYGAVDVLVNNAGISGAGTGQLPGGVDMAAVHALYETNFFGVIRVTEAFLPLLRRSSDARVINVSSGLGSLRLQTDPEHHFAAMEGNVGYPVTKAALNMLTVQYAKALAKDGISVNAVAPGPCATDLTAAVGRSPSRTAADGAAIAVRLATIEKSPTAEFHQDAGVVPW